MLVRAARLAVLCATLTALPIGCGADAPPVETSTEGPIGRTQQRVTTDSIIARAKEWVADKVPYCTVANHKWDATCSYTCNRPTAAWDAYRSDCSGFVSWCWELSSQPSSRTYMVDRAGADGWTTVAIDSLAPGDALVTSGHIMLFARFTSTTSFEIYQESNCGKVANFGSRTFKRNSDGTLLIGTDTRVYHPIRRNGLTVPPPADTGVADAPKPDAAPDGAAPDGAAPETAIGDAVSVSDSSGPIDDGGVSDGAVAIDDGEIAADDSPPEALTGSCALGSAGGPTWLVGMLVVGLVAASRRRAGAAR